MSDYLKIEHVVRQAYRKDQPDLEKGQDIVSSLEIPIHQMNSTYQKACLNDYVQYQRKLQTQSCQYQNKEAHRIPVPVNDSIVYL